MSASPMARHIPSMQGIPTRRVVINHETDMPSDYGTTPGGTLFGTTPGGTRIVYERAFLMQMRASPLANTPPANLPVIPGVTSPKDAQNNDKSNKKRNEKASSPPKMRAHDSIKEEEDQFSMDM